MIVKIGKGGTSFKGLSQYLTHDPESETANRVAWTKTLNLANDFVPAAVSEMIWTHRDAEILKREAGIRAGGRKNQVSVKHVSLNWDPRDNPSDQHMMATAQHFLKHMGWGEHQAILVAHDDKPYRHVHIMINRVHPETGRTHRDGMEQERAQRWADAYERENGIRCPQREFHPYAREKSMPRNMHMAFKNCELEFEKSERQLREFYFPVEIRQENEWKIVKDFHRVEREQHFAQGKVEFRQLRNAVYQAVREEFRDRWSAHYKAIKNASPEQKEILKAEKTKLIADQKVNLERLRDVQMAGLKLRRNDRYQKLLATQRADKAEFHDRLASGRDNSDFFHRLAQRSITQIDMRAAFRGTGKELGRRVPVAAQVSSKGEVVERSPVRTQPKDRDAGTVVARRASRRIGSIGVSLLDSLFNLGSAKPEPKVEPRDTFRLAAEEAVKQQQREQVQQRSDEKWLRDRQVYRE
jgi:hypothetical protein